MYFLNIIDEQGRFKELKVYNKKYDGQDNSHSYSYLYVRNELKKYYTMGFDNLSELEKKMVNDE